MHSPEEIMEISTQMGYKKTKKTLQQKLILGFIGGAMISLGYLAYIRVISSIAHDWGSFASFIGALVFPVGLIVILLGGGELVTGNMMAVSAAWFSKKISFIDLVKNLTIITLANFAGALFVSYFLSHLAGLTSAGVYLEETLLIAQTKISAPPAAAFFSGIGCNWFVGLAVWLCYGAKSDAGKILAIWFPVMTFVAIGFQHSVANMFVISAAIFEGGATWSGFISNFIPVYLGNIVGGAVFVSLLYFYGLGKNKPSE
ncbi:formate/nitrite transporter family protein [Enterococcus sp. BWT-B8]|uniref:formate/nitrite transporter family protein n=1 Tax=unclassified Enterococcus TaxID=2608891 RepID=UPI001E635539|nr:MULTISPECIES: formate/nitrite transporter family protein [unclassified Enterococcus]MCB5952397.1 formate/nitrite transporter family protein [Enterococcus sp. BWT-B8]MCB5955352.1 formate/nitrite transporter family protein [Enterococcus sp. CWB-B31]